MNKIVEQLTNDVPDGWLRASLAEVTEKIADRDHFTPIYVEHGIPIISPKDFDKNDKIKFYKCKFITEKAHELNRRKTDLAVNDIVFTRIGAGLGKACLVTPEMPEFSILHSAAMVRVSQKLVDPIYMVYVLKSDLLQKQISLEIQSIGVPDLGLDKINKFIGIFPEIKEQQKITKILTTVDDLIEKTEALIEKYQAIKQDMMHDLFTRGIDTNGQLRHSHHDAPHLYKQTELGWIPKEWDVKPFDVVCSRIKRGPSLSTNLLGRGVRYLTSDNVNDEGDVVWNVVKHLDVSANSLNSILKEGDVIINCVNSEALVGKTGYIGVLPEITTVGFNNFALEFNEDYVLSKYAFYFLGTDQYQRILKTFVKPAINQASFSGSDLFKTNVVVPKIDDQKKMIGYLDSLKEKRNKEIRYLDKLTEVKKGLMQDLLTGKVRVRI